MAEFQHFDITPYLNEVNDIVKRVREVADEQIKSVLHEAFLAGFCRAQDEYAADYGWHVPDFAPDFEEWVQGLIERHSHPPTTPQNGDT